MAKRLLECPVCKTHNDIDLPEGHLIYQCKKCKLKVRAMPVQNIEVPKKIEVKSAEEIPTKVAEEISKVIEESSKPKKKAKKKSTKTSKPSRKAKSED